MSDYFIRLWEEDYRRERFQHPLYLYLWFCLNSPLSVSTMEAANIIGNIIFVLLQCVINTVADCYPREFKMLPGGYNIYMKIGFQPVFKSMKLNDISQCGQLCAEKYFCNVWRYDGGDCQIFHSMKDNVTAIKSSNPTTKTYYESGEGKLEFPYQWVWIISRLILIIYLLSHLYLIFRVLISPFELHALSILSYCCFC